MFSGSGAVVGRAMAVGVGYSGYNCKASVLINCTFLICMPCYVKIYTSEPP